ncbi:tetratricopeptide repeat protein [Spongiivirga sp. MCCC 1A20706]|uniref:tetratricopeptide repeat protein n=1 Tax=Spongiivirga sp. MCCC 1A20706 TaxID=3160963 RepID=UPI00397794EB
MNSSKNQKMLSWIIFICVVIAAVAGLLYRNNGITKNQEQDKTLKELKPLLGLARYFKENDVDINNPDEAFEIYIQNQYNLDIKGLKLFLEKSKSKNASNTQKAIAHFISEEYNESLSSFEVVLKEVFDHKIIAIANSYIGHIFLQGLASTKRNPEPYLKKSLASFSKISNKDNFLLANEAETLRDLGIFYRTKGLGEKSFHNYQKAIDIYNKLKKENNNKGYDAELGAINQNIFALLNNPNIEFEIATNKEDYLLNALKLKEKAYKKNNTYFSELMTTIISSINHFGHQKNYELVDVYFKKAEKILNHYPNKSEYIYKLRYAAILSSYAIVIKGNKEFKKAKSFFLQSDKYFKQILPLRSTFDKVGYANNLHFLGMIHTDLNDYKNAKTFYEDAIEILTNINSKRPDVNSAARLADSYLAFALLYMRSNKNKSLRLAKEKAEIAKQLYIGYPQHKKVLEGRINECIRILDFK